MRLAIVVVVVVVCMSAEASAKGKPCASQRGNKLLAEAALAYKGEEWKRAATIFEAAFVECPTTPEILFNLGQVYRHLGDKAKAIAFYQSYLDEVPDAEDRADVEETIATLQKLLDADRASANAPPEGIHPADPGTAEPHETRPIPPHVEPIERDARAERWYQDSWGWGIVGAGAVGLGVGAWCLLHASDLRDESKSTIDQNEAGRLDESADRFTIGGGIVLSAGVTLAVIGVVKLARVSSPHKTPTVAVSCGVSGCLVAGSF